jgi:membrane associated rhomboid family serine protease
MSAIERVDVSSGLHRQTLRGATIGLMSGVVSGAVIGALTYTPCEGWCFLEPSSRGASAALGGAVFGVLGGVTGAIIGAFHQTEDWMPLTLKPTVTTTASGATKFGLQLTHTF